ncbi:pyridoxal-phosphate-dependent enzyme [Hyphomonas neptunium ATCC 15444]|uniref:Pyridoxal-phosphate-dependent enzyme n=3 Tax=Hyphomonas TaxID=85 RepID=Q0C2B7_HYPNA|nr:pyridoxal-phosphate dependent enzyme [Hyphomonas hirschiana]ABI77211.1 pyridoxal-phosphate-dependent enzyme [Hyphomonas neptunium ATCC 15444]KCZ93160.1 pyridoxal-phosphate-dependent enzyme [Hyphomonas hirschiana VP5]
MTARTDMTDCPFGIGNTPLTPFSITLNGIRHELLLKEERCNAFGSVKDRVAWYILSQTIAEKGPVEAVVDASSGNYGYALASICQEMGIAATIVSSSSISAFNAEGIKRAGARLVIAEPAPGECSNAARMRVAGEISAAEGQTFLNQYANFMNPASHEHWTAPEVFADGPFDACFVTSSSGGTARGFSDYLKAERNGTQLVLVEPEASSAFLAPACESGKLKVPGYGSQRRSSFAGMRPDPGMLRVDEASVLAAFTLLEARGLTHIGLSSVGVVVGALEWLSRQSERRRVVCVCADGDERYLDEIDSRYIPSVGADAFDAARARLEPVIASMAPEVAA